MLAASSAQAEDAQQSAAARALFQQGVALADKADWAGAADRFERSNELRPSPVVAYNLANAWVELGRLVEASEVLKQIEKDDSAKPQVKKDARTLLMQLEPRIGTLVVSVESQPSPPREVLVNDRPLPEAAIGVPTPIDPGSVVVTVMDGQNVLWTKRIDVAPGGEQRVTIELPKNKPTEPAVVPVPTPRETAERASTPPPARASSKTTAASDDSDRAFYEEPWVWVGVGAVVVAGVLTGVLLAVSSGGDEAEPSMPRNPIDGDRLDPEVIEVAP